MESEVGGLCVYVGGGGGVILLLPVRSRENDF